MKHYFLIIILVLASVNVIAEPDVDTVKVDQKSRLINSGVSEHALDAKFKQSETITTKYMLWVLFVLIIGIIISIAGIYWLKILLDKKNNNAESKRIEILAIKRLSTKLNVFVIKIDNTEYIITSSNDASTITRHRDIDE